MELDSLFALAWLRLSNSYGWLDDIGSAAAARPADGASPSWTRLPARDRILVQASRPTRTGDLGLCSMPASATGCERYPDDPDLWFELGEFIYHAGLSSGVATLPQAMEAFERAVELDPGFGPYQVHPLEFTIAGGDRAAAEERPGTVPGVHGGHPQRHGVLAGHPSPPGVRSGGGRGHRGIVGRGHRGNRVPLGYTNRVDRYDRLREMQWANRNRAGADHQWIFYSLTAEGALSRAARLLDSLDLTVGIKGLGAGWMLGGYSGASEQARLKELARPVNCEQPSLDTQCLFFVGWGLARSGDLSGASYVVQRMRHYADEAEGELAASRNRSADMVEGTIAAEEGRVAEARRLLAPLAPGATNTALLARTALAELEHSEGNLTEAIRYYSGNLYDYNRFQAVLNLARIYDSRGDSEQAQEYYRSFLTINRAGDQDLTEIVEAREALDRLGG